ncbi:hypothetical protein BASA81_007427 [Batrachochytrium salamandrivorans]|nr:hypothetical protein BASA81_007427 [Batrachochytrium salamandrivorans]
MKLPRVASSALRRGGGTFARYPESTLLAQKMESQVLDNPMQTATDCAQSASMLAKVYSKNTHAIDKVLVRAQQVYFPPPLLATFCSALARGRLVSQMPRFVQDNLQATSAQDMKAFTDQNLVTILASYSVMGKPTPKVGKLIATELSNRKMDSFQVKQFATVLQGAFVVLGTANLQAANGGRALCTTIATELASQPTYFAPGMAKLTEMNLLVKYFSLFRYRDHVKLFHTIAMECSTRTEEFKLELAPFQIRLLGYFANMQVKCPELCQTVVDQLKSKPNSEFGLRDVTLTFKYLVTLGFGPDEDLCEKLSRLLVASDLSEMAGFDFAVTLSCLQTWDLKDRALMNKFTTELVRRSNLDGFTGDELENLLLCFEWFDFPFPQLAQTVSQHLQQARYSNFTLGNLCAITTCLRRCHDTHQEHLPQLAQYVLQNWNEFSPNDFMHVLDMFAALSEPSPILDEVLNRLRGVDFDAFTNSDLAQLLGLFVPYRTTIETANVGENSPCVWMDWKR